MLRIYGHSGSSNVQKVLWCCSELGLRFEQRDVGGPFGGNHAPEYLALNPNGLVPTLDDDGFVLWESNVIVRYLAARHGNGSLYPDDLRERADAERWMDWQQTRVSSPMRVLYRALLLVPPESTPPPSLDTAHRQAAQAWTMLERRLERQPYVAGNALTVGDIALGNAVHRWFRLPIERPLLPSLRAWYDRLCERPAYRKYTASQ